VVTAVISCAEMLPAIDFTSSLKLRKVSRTKFLASLVSLRFSNEGTELNTRRNYLRIQKRRVKMQYMSLTYQSAMSLN
jgi:hypothetical protein